MTDNIVSLGEFNLNYLYEAFSIGPDETDVRLIVSQVYRELLKDVEKDTPAMRREKALADTEFHLNLNFGFCRHYLDDFVEKYPDVNIPALKVAVILDAFQKPEAITVPETIRQDVDQILRETKSLHENGPQGNELSESIFSAHTRALEILEMNADSLDFMETEDLSDYLSKIQPFHKIAIPNTLIGNDLKEFTDEAEIETVKLLTENNGSAIIKSAGARIFTFPPA